MSQPLLAAEFGNVGRVVVLLSREPNDLNAPHLHETGIFERRHGNPALLICKAIITPGSALGTGVGACGLPVRDEPERENEQPGQA